MMSIDHNQFPSYTGNQTQTNQREAREVSSAVLGIINNKGSGATVGQLVLVQVVLQVLDHQ